MVAPPRIGNQTMNTQVETETTVAKRQVAKHFLLDASGNLVEDFEDAKGIRYLDIGSGQTIDYIPANDKARDMLAAFGARTLATNEASAARNGRDATSAEQCDAIRERFASIDSGTWVDRTREGGPRIDYPTLAKAIFNVLSKAGKTDETKRNEAEAAYVKAFEADKAKAAFMRTAPGVEAEYKALRGTKTASVEDLAALAL